MDLARAELGARRVLEVLSLPRERSRTGLMQHEFLYAFTSDGWTMGDFRTATHVAYHEGWIDLDAHLYCLTGKGRMKLTTFAGDDAS